MPPTLMLARIFNPAFLLVVFIVRLPCVGPLGQSPKLQAGVQGQKTVKAAVFRRHPGFAKCD
jgi:hypothetical protein